MNCAICNKALCCHGSHIVSGPVWTCQDCGQFALGGPVPMYEGKVSLATDTFFTVCKECHDAANKPIQPTAKRCA